MDKGTIPQYPSETSSTGAVMVTRFRHEFRLPGEAVVTCKVWGQARESVNRSRLVGFMARCRHDYTTQLQCQGWKPYLKSNCQGKEEEPLLRLLSRVAWREPSLRLLLALSFKVTSCTISAGSEPSGQTPGGKGCTQGPDTCDKDHSLIPKSCLNFQIPQQYFS